MSIAILVHFPRIFADSTAQRDGNGNAEFDIKYFSHDERHNQNTEETRFQYV